MYRVRKNYENFILCIVRLKTGQKHYLYIIRFIETFVSFTTRNRNLCFVWFDQNQSVYNIYRVYYTGNAVVRRNTKNKNRCNGRYEIHFLPRRIRLPISKTKSGREILPGKPLRVNTMTDRPLTRSSLIPADLPDMMYYVLFLIRRFDGGKLLLLYVFRWRYE